MKMIGIISHEYLLPVRFLDSIPLISRSHRGSRADRVSDHLLGLNTRAVVEIAVRLPHELDSKPGTFDGCQYNRSTLGLVSWWIYLARDALG